ncbi:hypothetical protein D3C76_1217120 [compost metagenome]
MKDSTSFFVILPFVPDPVTVEIFTPCSRANLRTLGVARTSLLGAATGVAVAVVFALPFAVSASCAA